MQQLLEEKKVESEEIIDLTHYFKVLRKSWLSILLFAILVTGITVLVVLSITPKYTATATLLIEAQETKAVSIEDVVGIDSTQDEYYLTQFEILKSNQIAEKVIAQLKISELEEFNASLNTEKSIVDEIKEIPLVASLLQTELDEGPTAEGIRQAVLEAFKQNLVISPVRKTQLVKISFTSEDPDLAAKVANAIGYAYIDINLEARISTTKYATSWITTRLVELKDQLAASEQALSDFLVKEQLIDDSGIDALASQELANLTKRLAEVRDQRIETESAYTALRSSNITDVSSLTAIPSISEHPQVIEIRRAEIEAENDVQKLSKRYGPKHDKMKEASAKLKAVQDQARSITNKLINGIGKELQAIRKQEALLTKEISSMKGDFQELTVKKSKYQALQREVQTNRNVLNVFLSRQKETEATSDFEAANARFTDEALVPQEPSAPKKKLIVALAFVASFGFAVVMVFIIDAMKNTIESVKNFEDRFGLIPLGGIPQIKAKRFKKKPLDNTVFFDENEVSFSECIRSIRTSLMLSFMNRNDKRLAVTSSLPSEGKSTLALNLAMSMAKVERTLLIDCDLRKSSVAERFGYKKHQQGLVNHLLMGTELQDCVFKDEQSGLYVLPAGMMTPNPQELLSSKQFEELLNKLDSKFDRIIIDTPPTLPVSDSLLIGQHAAAVLVVVKANSTKQDAIKKTLSKLMSHNITIDGVVVNQVSSKTGKTEYGYGYGEYSHYGEQAKA
ncbi:polysaccharide biosynthesis tyrosine autokinase [Vibrio sp. JC009]|uniref:GumC family protein n=1 Tax=Vibrio sp. JC009 TaxID=2912314 RepID=UPI0023AEBFD7|nr:polysaccharide biosynthesis tyrosine autokinase [Vibrio sp. JC009]WED20645.1 polysaccharide biosynthesis tyrosine autokinase [Vibrio sp. JC009]